MFTRTGTWIALAVVAVASIFVYDFTTKKDRKEALRILGDTTSPVEWKRFIAKDGNFSILLPTPPQHAAESVPLPANQGSIKYDMYLAQQKNGTSFMISSIQYPMQFDTSDADHLLDEVLKEMVGANPANQLTTKNKAQFFNCPALDFVINNDLFMIQGKTFLSGKTLYVLTVMQKSGDPQDTTFKTFVDSFSFETQSKP